MTDSPFGRRALLSVTSPEPPEPPQEGGWFESPEWDDCCIPIPINRTPREFQAEFATPQYEVVGTSIVRRPDAVSFDYLTAFTFGPIAESDPSQGLLARVWRVQESEGTVYLSRANDGHDGWDPETVLFTYSGAPIIELDACFEQNGRVVVAAERHTGEGGAAEIWIYWFDPQASGGTGAFVFDNFGPGRTPRALLDSPNDIDDSDVLVFYIANGSVMLRQQRDRYTPPIETGFESADSVYLEDVVRGTHRIHILFSERDALEGTYSLGHWSSTLYPVYTSQDDVQVRPAVQFEHGTLRNVILEINQPLDDVTLQPGVRVLGGSLDAMVVDFDFSGDLMSSGYIVGWDLVDSTIEVTQPEDDVTIEPAVEFLEGDLAQIVIEVVQPTDDASFAPGVTFIGGTLEVL